MKKNLCLSIIMAVSLSFKASAQGVSVNSNGAPPDNSAMIDIAASNKGLLMPRMSSGQRDSIVSPAEGLMVYDLTTKCLDVFENSLWQALSCASGIPGAAGTISGSDTVCLGQNNVMYSVPIIQYATNYIWSYSGTGATVVGTGNTVSINFSNSATSGTLTVTGNNALGNGTVSSGFSITINGLPGSAGSITGTPVVCQGQSGVAYSVAAINNATSYLWSYTGAGETINGATNSITINFSGVATSGNLTVTGVSGCGNGNISPNYNIAVNAATVITSQSTGAQTTNFNGTFSPISVSVTGTNLTYQWYSNASSANSGGSVLTGDTSASYTPLTNVIGTTYYYCVVNGSCGIDTSMVSGAFTVNCADGTGGIITHVGGYTIHTFTSSGTFTPGCPGNVEVLVVAGGGGASGGGGGGGGGGFIYNSSYAVTSENYPVTVGAGGSGTYNGSDGNSGSNSVFGTLTAIGGGGGGQGASNGVSGGSGGGSGYDNENTYSGGNGTPGQGNNGGGNVYAISPYPAGGGGGAGEAGQNAQSNNEAGNGGDGLPSSISGSAVYYAAGGGGGIANGGNAGSGGNGGAGNGCASNCTGSDATDNTGGGGGGGAGNGHGGHGGSGIVIISYPTP